MKIHHRRGSFNCYTATILQTATACEINTEKHAEIMALLTRLVKVQGIHAAFVHNVLGIERQSVSKTHTATSMPSEDDRMSLSSS